MSMLKSIESESSDNEESEEGRQRCRGCTLLLCMVGTCCIVGIFGGVAGFLLQPHAPEWRMRDMKVVRFDLPEAFIRGAEPADTSGCPAYDICGMAAASGCTQCNSPEDFKEGCICYPKSGGTPAPPGIVMTSDISACPSYDPCGRGLASGCSKCLDSTWINDGCTCRQPITLDQFLSGFLSLVDTVTGNTRYLVNFTLLANIDVTNPNLVGAVTEPGTLRVFYREDVVGSTSLRALEVGGRSSQTIPATVVVDKVSSNIGMNMAHEILANSGLLKISAAGSIVAKVWSLSVVADVKCALTVNVFKNSQIVDKDCSYSSMGHEL